ncbi:hypothetical protein ACTFIV_006862 [Dictyostelium citrinum]
MEEDKNQIVEMHDNNSNGSNKSEEGLNEHEISYLKSLADDNSRTLALVQKINNLEAMNMQFNFVTSCVECQKNRLEQEKHGLDDDEIPNIELAINTAVNSSSNSNKPSNHLPLSRRSQIGSRVVNVDDIKPFLEEDRELFNKRIKDNSIPLEDEIEKIVEKRNRRYR